jgi:integrase
MTSQALTRMVRFGDFEAAAKTVIRTKKSPHTRKAYEADLQRWLEFCSSEGLDPAAPPIADVAIFRDSMQGAPGTVRRVLASLSSIYRSLFQGRAIRGNPFHPAILPWPAANALPKTRIVSDAQVAKMMELAVAEPNEKRSARDFAIITLLYDTGLRRVSVARIRRATFIDGTIHAIVKGEKEVELVLPSSSVSAIDTWLKHCDAEEPYVFPGLRGHINPATINKLVKRLGAAAGVPHVHPHSFRAAFVTAGYDAGLPEHEVQASVHHADPKTTRRYDRGTRGRTVATAVEAFRKRNK